jgi:pimeloyl-ACP methyl ester carboxylesterase
MPYLELPGARLNIADSGPSDAPALLFVHGNVMNLHMWDTVVTGLETKFRCIRWDLRLYGATGDDGSSFSYWDAARDGVAVLEHLGVPSATWVGHSQGGFTSLRAALLEPARVDRLILVDTVARSFGEPDLIQMSQVRDGFAGGHTEDTARVLLQLLLQSPAHEQQWLPLLVEQGGQRLAKAVSALMAADDIADRVGEIVQPALVIHGRTDFPIPFERGVEFADALRGSDPIVAIDTAGHTPPVTHPERVLQVISSCLAGAPPN